MRVCMEKRAADCRPYNIVESFFQTKNHPLQGNGWRWCKAPYFFIDLFGILGQIHGAHQEALHLGHIMGAIENIRVNHGLAALIHNDLQRLHIPIGIAGDDGTVALNQDCIAAVHGLSNIFGTSVCITVDPRTVFHIHAGDLCKVVDHRNHIFTCAGHSDHIRIGHMLDDGAILAVINGLMDLGALGCNAGNAQPGLQIHINGLSANGQAKGLAVANGRSQITNALRHSHSAILFQVKVALTFVRYVSAQE